MRALICALLATVSVAYNVTYNNRAFVIDGKPTLLVAGSIHYPRSTPDMWPKLMQLSKEGGINVIDTYLHWDIHEPVKGQYDFSTGNRNLPAFLQAAKDAGLWVNLRIGPYVCAEWNYGGLPAWLRDEPNMAFRTFNGVWMREMKRFVDVVMKVAEPYLARNGGPVIILQIENEYGDIQWAHGEEGNKYVAWSADLANSYNAGVPWIMCQQDNAPDTVISTCNGYYCDNWLAKHFKSKPTQPGMFTEHWPGWFQHWGRPFPTRPTEDVAFSVLRFYAKGGTYQNYYMYHGGTNFGRTSGGPWVTTSYDYDVPLNEYGLPHKTKYWHTARMHQVLMSYAEALVSNPVPEPQGLGLLQEAHQYGPIGQKGSVVFLSNIDTKEATVQFRGRSYSLPAWSVSIIDGVSLDVVFNSAVITAQPTKQPEPRQDTPLAVAPSSIAWYGDAVGGWSASGQPVAVSTRPLEQINITKDKTDYLWYTTTITLTPEQIAKGIVSLGLGNSHDATYVFLDGIYKGQFGDVPIYKELDLPIAGMAPGQHTLQLLSMTVGLINFGPWMEAWKRGILGDVKLAGSSLVNGGFTWRHYVGMRGEHYEIYSAAGTSRVPWDGDWQQHKSKPLSWYRLNLTMPTGSDDPNAVWALDLKGMGRGAAWVNGQHIGRYFLVIAEGNCKPCDYAGAFYWDKCLVGCGEPSQRYYHVPRSWLRAGDNMVVLFEETGGDPSSISLVRRN